MYIIVSDILDFLENVVTLKSTACKFQIEKLSSPVHMLLTSEQRDQMDDNLSFRGRKEKGGVINVIKIKSYKDDLALNK